jgi:hypothetical protein
MAGDRVRVFWPRTWDSDWSWRQKLPTKIGRRWPERLTWITDVELGALEVDCLGLCWNDSLAQRLWEGTTARMEIFQLNGSDDD